jgi:hypothetical protein
MKPIKMLAAVMIVGGLGLGSSGMGTGVASATPVAPIPLRPGHDGDCPPFCGGPNFNGNGPNRDGNWNGRWNQNQRHDVNQRWDDRWGAPPWGWGPPPAVYWNGARNRSTTGDTRQVQCGTTVPASGESGCSACGSRSSGSVSTEAGFY